MAETWTPDRIAQLAPDPASLKAGQGLAHAKKWVSIGCDDRVVWGECQGSGAKPYQTQFDLSEPGSKCSCPSRKFPCKHALGLMLIFTSSVNAVKKQTAPAWAEEWINSRADKAKKKQEKAEAPPKPVDEAAQAERREKRLARVAEGLSALKIWIEDLVKGGITTAANKGYSFFDEPARRMIDAQAPGAARRVQQLGGMAASGAGWERPFVENLASLYLLIQAFEGIKSLPETAQADVLAALGIPLKSEDASSFLTVRDTWEILSLEVELENKLRVQRTWLCGRESKRSAFILAFAHGNTPLDISLSPAMCFEGELAFFPGNGLRAVVKSRNELKPLQSFQGLKNLDELCDSAGVKLAEQPWLQEVTVALQQVVPVKSKAGWMLTDADQRALPAHLIDEAGWLALAISGGHPIDMVTAYDGRTVRPLALMTGGEYVALPSGRSGQ